MPCAKFMSARLLAGTARRQNWSQHNPARAHMACDLKPDLSVAGASFNMVEFAWTLVVVFTQAECLSPGSLEPNFSRPVAFRARQWAEICDQSISEQLL